MRRMAKVLRNKSVLRRQNGGIQVDMKKLFIMRRNMPNSPNDFSRQWICAEAEGRKNMGKEKSYEATIRAPLETLRRTYREINMTGDELYAKTGLKRNEKLLTLDVKFENGYSAEINAYPGDKEYTGFVEVILMDAEGNDRIWDTDGENILDRFALSDGDMTFNINVKSKEAYVLVNRSVYDSKADTDVVETMAVDADWLAYYLWQNEEAPKDTLWGFLEEYTTEDVAAWYDAALMEGAVAFSFSMPGPVLQFVWATDDCWKAEALLETMDKLCFTPQQMLNHLRGKKEGAE